MFIKERRIRKLEQELEELKNAVFVEDCFSYCSKCGERDKILRSEAKTFKALNGFGYAIDRYTTEENYKLHRKEIREDEEKVKSKA